MQNLLSQHLQSVSHPSNQRAFRQHLAGSWRHWCGGSSLKMHQHERFGFFDSRCDPHVSTRTKESHSSLLSNEASAHEKHTLETQKKLYCCQLASNVASFLKGEKKKIHSIPWVNTKQPVDWLNYRNSFKFEISSFKSHSAVSPAFIKPFLFIPTHKCYFNITPPLLQTSYKKNLHIAES